VVDLIKQRNFKLFGLIYRMDDNKLIKTVLLGMVEGNRPCGRLAISDDIVDWCGCSLPEAVQPVNDSQNCRAVTGLNGSLGP